jgi:hypothetical protein
MQKEKDLETKAIAEEMINIASEYVLVWLWGENCVKIEQADNPKNGILKFHDGTEKVTKNANKRFWKNMKKVFLYAKRFCDERLREIEEEAKND